MRELFLLKTATLFARRDGCEIENDMVFKANAGAPQRMES